MWVGNRGSALIKPSGENDSRANAFQAILSQLFYLSISLFGPLAHDSLKRWFAAKYPKYAAIRTQPMDAANPHDGDAAHPLTDALVRASIVRSSSIFAGQKHS
jgi:hypothetical protein